MYTLTQAKDFVINQGYAIKNDDSVEKLKKVLRFCFPDDISTENIDSSWKYYFQDSDTDFSDMWFCGNIWRGNSINLSEIELPKQITIEMVIELTKKHTNDMDLGSELRKLLNN